MLQKTHSVAGFISAEIVLVYQDVSFLSWEAAGALLLGCLAGTLADVDKPGSTMAKVLFPLSALLRFLKVRHRSVTHSCLFIITLMILAFPLPTLFFWVFIIAYASHPLIDLLNEKGVQLFWPNKMRVRVLPKFIAIDTGSMAETIIRGLLFVISLWIPFMTIKF